MSENIQTETYTSDPEIEEIRNIDDNEDVFETQGRDKKYYDRINEDNEEEVDFLEDFEEDTEEIELLNIRLTDITSLMLDRFPKIKSLCVRQNLVTKIDGIESLKDLEELDLYDNRISYIENLNNFPELKFLDLSFNKIRVIENLEHLTKLVNLYFVQNRISKIQNLDNLINVTNLELGANKIRVIENLDKLVNLEQLWLGKNKITEFQNLENLRNLKILSIQSNRLTQIKGLEGLVNLEEIYMSHNGIQKIEGFENNLTLFWIFYIKLRVIDVSNNLLTKIENISHLTELEEFWANNNQFSDFEELPVQMGHLKKLNTIYLEGNPMQTENQAIYRLKVKTLLPQISQLDATYVS
ncbi:L domain-like protein [Rhizophagus irregularis]|nr:L domain-like protein [Rhizophagus irregularis]